MKIAIFQAIFIISEITAAAVNLSENGSSAEQSDSAAGIAASAAAGKQMRFYNSELYVRRRRGIVNEEKPLDAIFKRQ